MMTQGLARVPVRYSSISDSVPKIIKRKYLYEDKNIS